MRLFQAQQIANRLVAEFAPYCERIEIAGSIRRRKSEVKDIEIVCIRKTVAAGLFGDGNEIDPRFCSAVNQYVAVKGKPDGKYTQRIIPISVADGESIKLDLFTATPENWGLIFALRTGSADFSRRLANKWVTYGYHSIDGRLVYQATGESPVLREEEDLFALLGIEWVPPDQRI